MANPFIEKEINRIFETTQGDDSLKAAMAAAWTCANFKAFNIKVFNVQEASSLSDYYILCTAENTIQSQAIISELVPHLKKLDIMPISTEGLTDGDWILLDLGGIILHIFQEASREIYTLDQLWVGHPQVEIPQEFFTGFVETKDSSQSIEDEKNYF